MALSAILESMTARRNAPACERALAKMVEREASGRCGGVGGISKMTPAGGPVSHPAFSLSAGLSCQVLRPTVLIAKGVGARVG